VQGGFQKRRPLAWGNVVLMGGGVGLFVSAFLFALSLIRTYVEPPKIPTPRPMLASAESMLVEVTGVAELDLWPLNVARTSAMENLATVMAQGGRVPPPAAQAPTPATSVVPMPPRRPRETLIRLSGNVPIPRPRPQD
jgi:hypothetical protein